MIDVGDQLAEVLGQPAKWLFCAGLFSAGITSSITAPLAAAYAANGCFGAPADLRHPLARTIFLSVIFVGVACVWLAPDSKPHQLISVAQVANGLLLPIIAVVLIVVMNRASLLGKHANGWISNGMGAFTVVIVGVLGFFKIYNEIVKLLN